MRGIVWLQDIRTWYRRPSTAFLWQITWAESVGMRDFGRELGLPWWRRVSPAAQASAVATFSYVQQRCQAGQKAGHKGVPLSASERKERH